MATNDMKSDDVSDDNQLCCMEATVVSGFEECARGEAKEKFGTDVRAVRGRITWQVPIHRVKEVITMGSIDNCWVVMNSIPHFGFTGDQYENLARLQKQVVEFDWDSGLRVWRKFNDFPHPISSTPDVIPPVEELVDVVISKPRAQMEKSSKDKKNKKGGRGKKKEKRNTKTQTNSGNKDAQDKEENRVEREAGVECKQDGDAVDEVPSVSVDENGTKKVVIKRVDPNEPCPEIEIKVLIPGPNESVFPTDVDVKDQRDVEPMDVDLSMHQNANESLNKSPMKSNNASPSKCQKDELEHFHESELSQPNSNASPFKQPTAAVNIISSAKDFASSVIKKLTSGPPMPSNSNESTPELPQKVKDFSSSPSCVTPPPTPVQNYLDFFMKSKTDSNPTSTSVDDGSALSADGNTAVSSNSPASIPSSSVDNAEIPVKETNEQTESKTNEQTHEKSESLFDEDDKKSSPPSMTPNENPSTIENETVIGETDKSKISLVKKERDPTKPTFRVTCNRVGDNHAFDSASAAASLGSAIIRYFGWSVDLKNFDIEVLLNIDNEEVTTSLGITKTSLHNRNLVVFGPTSLRATICYNMLRLCRIRNGDFVCDPMCGTSSIPIEGSLKWTNCFHFGGDYHELGISRTFENISAIRKKRLEEKRDTLKIGTVQWNIEHFPLRDQCVDVFVSDLPFGHRMGSRTNNRTLYPSLLSAMARTARMGARACLLTEDRISLIKALQTMGKFWQRRVTLSINMGGLAGYVFLLTRTTQPYTAPTMPRTTEEKSQTLETSAVDNLSTKLESEECGETLESVESLNEAISNLETNEIPKGEEIVIVSTETETHQEGEGE